MQNMTAYLTVTARRDPALQGELARARAGLGELREETRRAGQAQAAAAAHATQLGTAQQRLGVILGSNRAAIQNVAFQTQDMAVQLAAGTSASVALGQNLPQLLGGLGVFGALAGAAVAVLAPLAGHMLAGAGGSDEMADATDRLADATERLRGFDRLKSDLDELRAKYGGVTGEIVQLNQELHKQGFSANPASFTPGGAFPSLHEGGRRADAGTRLVDPSVFLGAPRLHDGGMRPGEYPAILLDDERVLTAAQQESTARTIDGLARLATAPRAAPGVPPVTVIVHGAQGAERAEATARQDDQGGMTIEVFLDQVDAGMGRRIASGRGATASAIQSRWQLAPKGAR